MMSLQILAVIALLANIHVSLVVFLGMRKMRSLQVCRPSPLPLAPKVSIIVPACNEAHTIEPALRSLLAQEYTNIEIVVINDRSIDGTGAVVEQIQKEHPECRILTISTLPDGWLGKNNALHHGAMLASGEYLLFTDADIIFAPSTVSRAMSLMLNEKLDHLSLIFKNIAQGALLNAMMVDAGGGLFYLFRPWKVREQKSKYFMGVGAFNLLRKTTYQAIGGHECIKMHPIDDIMLGKRIKQQGFKQECLSAYEFLTVHWYASTGKMIQGLMKNIFALYNYKICNVLMAVCLVFILSILPLWGVLLCGGPWKYCFLLSVLIRLASVMYGAKVTKTQYGVIPCSLLTPYISTYIVLSGTIKTLLGRGIEWRGTYYSLEKLKEAPRIL